ncbi:hypothetical protein J1C55_08005 [Winogradskyella sp. E313]|uniref:Uncharacterized protein n=1 Tax=Winogradskyella immobilis TaxID=2816852 RepID=A0ABS8ENP2_9FLAO|nr:hypothetical protein [Winogradskyella immobilis]
MLSSTGITFLSYFLKIKFNVDLTLLSIAIIFPLVFSIRGSFRRREKALEHLSEFKSTLSTVKYYLLSKKELADLYKDDVDAILLDINTTVLEHLRTMNPSMTKVDASMDKVYQFVLKHESTITRQIREKTFRFMKDMHEAVENLNSIHIHRTPISLKAYCLIFIFIFPIIYAPEVIINVGNHQPQWIVYAIVLLTQFILVSLYNIQDQLEHPFDNVGIDDINLDNYRIDR